MYVLKQLCVCVLLVFIRFYYVHGAYFSMSDMRITIPGNRSAYPAENYSLVTLLALPHGKKAQNVTYSLDSNNEKYLQIVSSNGDIQFTKNFFKEKDVSSVIVNASAVDSSGKRDVTTFQVDISSSDSLDCHLIVPDLCYWQSANYRIFENTNPSIIGTLNSAYLARFCPDFKIYYNITKGGSRIKLIPPTSSDENWYMQTRVLLERDILHSVRPFLLPPGELIHVSVICFVEDTNGTKMELPKNILVHVLDENDNPPISQYNGDILVYLDSPVVKKGDLVELKHEDDKKKLLIIDRDSPGVNNHRITIIDDKLKLLKVNCTTFPVTYGIDDEKEAQTAVSCKLIFARSMQIPKLPYTVILQVNDTTLLPESDENLIRIPIHFHALHSDNSPRALGYTKPPELSNKLILYPEPNVYVFRSAAPYARITQPRKVKGAKNFVLLNHTSFDGAFNVTREGIIYVSNLDVLRTASANIRVIVQWDKDGKYQTDELKISVMEEPSHTCMDVPTNVKEWFHCADYLYPPDCEEACAIGTGGSTTFNNTKYGGSKRCMWRGPKKAGKVQSALYPTCTPDIKTCPDSKCDSLEQLHYLICPQDCTTKVLIPTNLNHKTGRGIEFAEGACKCDDTGSCFCNEKVETKSRYRNKNKNNNTNNSDKINNETTVSNISGEAATTTTASPNISRQIGPEIASCGTSCLLGILAGGLFLLGAVAAVVACWRLGRVHKVRAKFSNDNNDLSAPLSDYVDRGIIPENAITLNFDMTTALNQQNHKLAPDPKWEFPRSQLIIEQTLGEGEFGRVLRARARDIAGQQGYTVVAVKTLKEDAREAELADLLSEYQLLKEVSHPNIIRLLGASTLPGGPVYLIIEFAHYGSLRSYLRRSRHLKSESQPPFSARLEEAPRNDNYDEPKLCKVTPTDILSFAWQISNGMSYLSDVKLVHRDLAARNVLLSDRKVCKISDFGLTRDIYEDDAYFKRSKGRVPVKWMAPESLSDHVYTTKSDVWSFGILVWELVTLGATPYPGIQVQNLFHLLKSGYRMERPENCSPTLFKIMKSCWHIDPEQRPSFHDLSTKWEKMLGDQVEYLDLTPNAIHNRSYFCTLDENEDDLEDNNITITTLQEEDEEEQEENNTEENLQGNLATNEDYPKCGDSDKLLQESKVDNIQSNQLSPLIDNHVHGYETPIKSRYKTERASTPTNENPQYYTNMDAANNK